MKCDPLARALGVLPGSFSRLLEWSVPSPGDKRGRSPAPLSDVACVLDQCRRILVTAALDIKKFYSRRCDTRTDIHRRTVVSDDETDPALFAATAASILAQLVRNRRGSKSSNKRRRTDAPLLTSWNRDHGGRLRCLPRLSYDENYCGFDLPSAYLLTRPMLKRLHGNRLAPVPWF